MSALLKAWVNEEVQVSKTVATESSAALPSNDDGTRPYPISAISSSI
jgi:hypothetical protein